MDTDMGGDALVLVSEVAPAPRCESPAAGHVEWTAFYSHEYPRLTGALFAYTGDRELASELAQDAMACAWRKWRRVAEYENPAAWTYRVAVNLARSRWRRTVLSRRIADHRATDEASPEPDIGARLAVRQAVDALPQRQRLAIVLRYFSDMPVEEVARVMSCRPGTVTALTVQAITNLRERAGLTEP